jgi:hypothetical protein
MNLKIDVTALSQFSGSLVKTRLLGISLYIAIAQARDLTMQVRN